MRVYCLTSAFFGSTRMRTRSSSDSSFSDVMTGMRPTNSGIMPYLFKSSGSTFFRSSASDSFLEAGSSLAKPRDVVPTRWATMSARPTKAPPRMNRMFVVSMGMSSCWGCLRPPWGGTLASQPSTILRSACWTPSPDTSRVMERFSALRAILSISSM